MILQNEERDIQKQLTGSKDGKEHGWQQGGASPRLEILSSN